jgi:hypothetical protein
MGFVGFSVLLFAASLFMLGAPFFNGLHASASSLSRSIAAFVVHFSPIVLATIYFRVAESGRLSDFGYERPSTACLYMSLAAVQALATGEALFLLRFRRLELLFRAVSSTIGCLGVAIVVQGALACANGNCL